MQVNTQSPNRANVVRLLASHGQAGTYPSIRQISTHKRPDLDYFDDSIDCRESGSQTRRPPRRLSVP